MKKYLLLFVFVLLNACSNSHTPQNVTSNNGSMPNSPVIGGWAPVFFTEMDNVQLDNISYGLNHQTIKRVTISYPTKMEALAEQIHDYLEEKTHIDIPLQTIELKDTDQVKYNLTQVIVTLYFK